MTENARYNGRIPTDPTTVLILLLAITGAATQLTTDQAQALTQALAPIGGITELAVLVLRLLQERR
jgi:hypothetical protein